MNSQIGAFKRQLDSYHKSLKASERKYWDLYERQQGLEHILFCLIRAVSTDRSVETVFNELLAEIIERSQEDSYLYRDLMSQAKKASDPADSFLYLQDNS